MLEIQNWDVYFDDDKTDYSIIIAYYDKQDVSDLEMSIKNSQNWIYSVDVKSELKIFIPSQLKFNKNSYFSIYNKNTNEYNSIPDKPGKYEFFTMKYDKMNKTLEIHNFKYLYK